jgi:hypothetical protein
LKTRTDRSRTEETEEQHNFHFPLHLPVQKRHPNLRDKIHTISQNNYAYNIAAIKL